MNIKIEEHNDYAIKGFFNQYRFLSNFQDCVISYNGLVYHSTEAAYQASKSLFEDVQIRFCNLTPSESKKLGRIIKCRSDWDNIKYQIMLDIVRIKFKSNEFLANLLLNTGNRYLEETNYWKDTYWGVCNGIGENNLGKILMIVRSELINDVH